MNNNRPNASRPSSSGSSRRDAEQGRHSHSSSRPRSDRDPRDARTGRSSQRDRDRAIDHRSRSSRDERPGRSPRDRRDERDRRDARPRDDGRPTRDSRGSARPSSGGRGGQRPSGGNRPPNNRKPGSKPPQRSGRPPVKKRKRRLPIFPILFLIALGAVIFLVFRTCSGGESTTSNGKYELVFSSQILLVGESGTVSVSGLPEDNSVSVTWSSNNTDIVSVDAAGNLRAKKVGTATIAAKIGTENIPGSVQVVESISGVNEVTLNNPSLSIVTGHSFLLKAKVTMDDDTEDASGDYAVKWESSDNEVARVSQEGLVTARNVGTATITATVGSKSATCSVTVNHDPSDALYSPIEGYEDDDGNSGEGEGEQGSTTTPSGNTPNSNAPTATSLALSQGAMTLAVGETITLSATVSPSSVVVAYYSSDSSVATVTSGGVVTALAPGSIVITAKAENLTTTCTITIAAPSGVPAGVPEGGLPDDDEIVTEGFDPTQPEG